MATPADAHKQCSKCQRLYKEPKDFLDGTSGWTYGEGGNLWFACKCGQSLMLTRGRFDWFSPSLFLSPQAQEAYRKIAATKDLPHMPAGVMELQRVVRDEASTPAQLASALKAVPALAAETLMIANNLKADPRQKITSIEHAIVYVGRRAVADMTSLAAVRAFKLKTKKLTGDKLWKEALLTGKIAEQLARKFAPHLMADEVYIAGAMANVGKAVGAICFPEQVDKVHELVTASRQLPCWRDAEKQAGALPHAVLGEVGAVFWGFPQYVRDAASKHHELPTPKPSARLTHGDLVTFANQLTHWVGLAASRIEKPLLDACAVQLGLKEKDVEALASELIEAEKKASAAAA